MTRRRISWGTAWIVIGIAVAIYTVIAGSWYSANAGAHPEFFLWPTWWLGIPVGLSLLSMLFATLPLLPARPRLADRPSPAPDAVPVVDLPAGDPSTREGMPDDHALESDACPHLILNRYNKFEGDEQQLEEIVLDIGERLADGARPLYVIENQFVSYVETEIKALEAQDDRDTSRLVELKDVRRQEREWAPFVNRCVGMIVVADKYGFFRRGDQLGSAFYEARWAAVGLCGLADEFWNFKFKAESPIKWWLWARGEERKWATFVVPPDAEQIMQAWYWDRPEREAPGMSDATAYPVGKLSEDVLRRRALPALARIVSGEPSLAQVTDITEAADFVLERTDLDRWVFARCHPYDVVTVRP
jgi:hypothetical protein